MAEKVIDPDGGITIMAPLKKDGEAERCPEVDRCQLVVEELEKRGEVDVRTTEEAKAAVGAQPATLAKKSVSIGLTSKECADIEVKVGLVKGSVPRAVGHHWVEWENFYDPWEEYLTSCARVPNKEKNFTKRPLDLTQVRYVTDNGPVSLLHYKYIVAEGDAALQETFVAVRVFKKGHDFIKAISADNHAVISAALSYDFNTLYIVYSSLPPPTYEREASWEKHVWNEETNKWSLVAISSLDMRDVSTKPMTVDRNGRIGGAFETETENWSNVTGVDGNCTAVDGVKYRRQWLHNGSVTTGENECYSIEGLKYINGDIYIGYSIIDGDFKPIVVGDYTSNSDSGHDYTYNCTSVPFDWTDDVVERNWAYSAFAVYDNLSFGSISLDKVFDGNEYNAQAHWHMHNWSDGESPYQHEGYLAAEIYSEKSGYRNLTVLGGWIIVTENFTDRILDSYEEIYEGAGQLGQECPPNGDLITFFQKPTDDYGPVTTYGSVHPINLQAYLFSHTFLVHDQESGDTYYGALIMDDVDDEPYWRVWKNNQNITAQMNQCVNMNPNEFSAIYFP